MYALFFDQRGFDMQLSFKPALPEDVDTLFCLNKELIDRYEDVQNIPYDDVLKWVRRKIEKAIHTYTRIYADGVHAGFYRFVANEEKMELDDLYIFPEFQSRGIGTRVVEKCCGETEKSVMLYVFIRNTGAWQLYQRLGFEIQENIHDSRYIMVRENL